MAIQIIDVGLSFNSNHTDRVGAPKGIVLHHAAAQGSVETVHAYHKNSNGWAGIGYHYYVRKNGAIYRGRPDDWMGAHTVGYNDMLGVCAEGDFDEESMNTAQQSAIALLVEYLREQYGALPIYGHRDLDSTSCPGTRFPFGAIINTPPTVEQNYVRDFQQAAIADGVPLAKYGADGIWGGETAAVANRLLQNGNVGERVRFVQRRLIALGYNLGAGADDGIFGGMTEKAVRAFQKKESLRIDGIVGEQTIKALAGV